MTALLLALSLLLCLSACGSADPVCGRYLCVGAEAEGIQMSAALLGEESTALNLTADGRGTLTRGEAQGRLSWSREGDLLRMELRGRLDTLSSPDFLESFTAQDKDLREVEIDCSALEYISSSGLRVLLKIVKNCCVTLLGPNEDVCEVMEKTGIDTMVQIKNGETSHV